MYVIFGGHGHITVYQTTNTLLVKSLGSEIVFFMFLKDVLCSARLKLFSQYTVKKIYNGVSIPQKINYENKVIIFRKKNLIMRIK